jgi:hypothetical protein
MPGAKPPRHPRRRHHRGFAVSLTTRAPAVLLLEHLAGAFTDAEALTGLPALARPPGDKLVAEEFVNESGCPPARYKASYKAPPNAPRRP